MANTNPTFPKPMKPRPTVRSQAAKRMMGTNADDPNRSNLKGYSYNPTRGGPGKWVNKNGTQVGESSQEDSTITPRKSTGDTAMPRLAQAAKLRRLKGKAGY